MKYILTVIATGALAILAGCERGTSGGPGATEASSTPGIMSQAEDTFSLVVPSAKLTQGSAEAVTIGIRRGQNFGQDVSLKLGALPEGVRLDTASPQIKHGDTEIEISLQAAEDAALGDFTVSVTGEPATGAAAVGEMKIVVAKRDPDAAPSSANAEAQEQWKRDTLAMETELSRLDAEHDALQERVNNATGQTRADLSSQAEQVKIEHDKLKVAIADRKSESENTWERIKKKVTNGLDGN